MGASWMYQPQGDTYKSTRLLLETLVQTRAKGGNLLLDIGPKANGEIPIEEEDRLREMEPVDVCELGLHLWSAPVGDHQ